MRPFNKAADQYKVKVKPKKADELWPMVMELDEIGMGLRRPFEQQWLLTMAFIMGKQYTRFNTTLHALQLVKLRRGRTKSVDNQILPKYRRQVADLIKSNPEMCVVPNSSDPEDIKAAKMGDKILKSFFKNNRMRRKLRRLGQWIYATGNGFLDDRWDEKGGPIERDENGNLVYLGDADVGVWSPFDILVPYTGLGDIEVDEFPWLIKKKWRELSWFPARYSRGKEIESEGSPSSATVSAAFLGTNLAVQNNEEVPGAFEINLKIKPNALYPKGLHVIAANGIVLQKDIYPYESYHLEHFKDIDMPGLFWGLSTSEFAIPLQRTWNSTKNDIEDFNKSMARGKGLVPRSAKLNRLPDDEMGEWLEYTPVMGHKPEIMTLKGLPATYPLILEITKGSFENLYSQHEVSRGTNRSDIRSGEMAVFLREQDAHGNIPMHSVFEEGIEALAARVLQRIQSGYKTERMIKVRGTEGNFEVFAFKGADLRSNTDVSVKRQSSVPDSRSMREAQILDRFQKGLYGDPLDPRIKRKVLRMVEDSIVEDIYGDDQLDEHVARWENDVIMSGEADVYLVNSYDNHSIHLKEHGNAQKVLEFQRLKLQESEKYNYLNSVLLQHMSMHEKFLEEKQQQMLSMMERAKGGRSGQ